MSESPVPSFDMGHRLMLGVLVSGRGSNLQAIMEAVEDGRLSARVAVVMSNKKEAPALELARKRGIPTLFLNPSDYPDRSGYDEVMIQTLKMYGVEVVVLAGYMRLVTPMLVQTYPNRIINIHPSLLPAFPGLQAQSQAIAYGAKVSGCTVHFVDEEVDHGPIIAQTAVPVLEGDSEASLTDRILAEEHRLLPRVLQLYAEGRVNVDGRKVLIL